VARPGHWLVTAFAVAAAASGCRDAERATAPSTAASDEPHERELAALHAFEEQRRAAIDFAALPPSDVALGPDPYRIAALRDGRLIGLLRGESAAVLLDASGAELARIAAPRSPGGLAVSGDDALVVGEAARELVHYRVAGDRLERAASLAVDAIAMRDVALAPDGRTAYVVEDHDGRLLAVSLARDPRTRALHATGIREVGRCHGPVQVAAIAEYVAVDCLLDHTIEIRRGGGDPLRIRNDGPLWRFALRREADGGLLIAAGGVEDHPLVREDGGFGYIDSFVYLYRLAPGAAQPERLAAVNTSALGAVTPKWLAFRTAPAGGVAVTVAGYASASLVTLTWHDTAAEPTVERTPLLPGTAAAAVTGDGVIAANPLFDGWVVARGGEPQLVAVAGSRPQRPLPSRIGELLFFTTLMSPWNSSEGQLSRFTCETCHHEGYVDGRVHFTGRGSVHAATRPLLGLFNNRPHFSRALDRTTTQMVHAEFRVANRHNGRDPWFALTRADVPWLDRVAGAPAQLSPELLRESLMTFLSDFTHRANPAAIDHAQFTERERAGAAVFRDRCASCHAARLVVDEPRSAVPFERWEALVLSASGPIVWASDRYARTGVEPYVHPDGARPPALRRLYKKWPYFTNGSARSLDAVLDRFAWRGDASFHDAAPGDAARLGSEDKQALRAFLDLL
jgi:DNA-binding beta-propeller fold protein YncE